jgi:hypothetical protein
VGGCSWTPRKDDEPPGMQVVGRSQAKVALMVDQLRQLLQADIEDIPVTFAAPARPRNAVNAARSTPTTL